MHCSDIAGTVLPRKPDARFSRHGAQPRGKRLTRRQRQLCRLDHAFCEALRIRVSSPARWDAFIADLPTYRGKPCKRCGSEERRVYDGSCYTCMLVRNRGDFELIRRRIMPPAARTLHGLRDIQERVRREHKGECVRYQVGAWKAEQFPTGRVRLISSTLGWDMHDLATGIDSPRLFDAALRDPDLALMLGLLGWIDKPGVAQVSGQALAAPLPEWLAAMEVRPHADVLAGNPLAGPVDVSIVPVDGQRYVKRLSDLSREEAHALCCHFWEQMPTCIQALGNTPAAAYQKYQLSKQRGYI